jgi:hypothetical protein
MTSRTMMAKLLTFAAVRKLNLASELMACHDKLACRSAFRDQ